jgi:hypothetical protein
MQPPILELRKKRDFGEVISDTFQFVRQNFKPLLRSSLYISGPFLLLAAIYFTISYVNMLSSISVYATERNASYAINMLVSVVFIAVGLAVQYAVVHDYTRLLLEGRKKEDIKVADVWQLVKRDVWKAVGINIVIAVIIILCVAVLVLLVAAMGPIAILFVLIGMVGIFILFVKLSLSFPAALLENYSVFNSLARSWSMTQGMFWSTIGTVFILGLVVGVCSYVLYIPIFIMLFLVGMHGGNMDIDPLWKTLIIVFQSLGYLIIFMAYMIPSIGLILQYLNCVERREGHGLLERIDNLKMETDESHWGEEQY